MVNKDEEQRSRRPSPKSADGDSTTDDGDGELVSSKIVSKPQRRGSVSIADAKDAYSQVHSASSPKSKPAIELTSGNWEIMDDGALSRNLAGKDRRQEESISDSADAANEEQYETHLAPKSKAKLGKIGGKKRVQEEPRELPSKPINDNHAPNLKLLRSPSADVGSSNNRDHRTTGTEWIGRAAIKPKSPSSRETSQERANRKRAELKRNLEDKSKSTAKKKRKF